MKTLVLARQVACAMACAPLLLLFGTSSFAQTVAATIPAQEGSLGLPFTIAVNPFTQLVYIAGNGVEVVNQRTNEPITTINVGQDQLSGIAINPITRKLYVLDYLTGLYVIDLTSNAVAGQFAITNGYGVAYNPITNRVYSLDSLGNVWVNDGTTGALIHQIELPDYDNSASSTITVNPATNRIYIPKETAPGQLFVVDGGTNEVTTVPLQGDYSYFAGVDALRNIVYVSDQQGQVDVLDGRTNKEITLISGIGLQPEALSVDPLTRKIYLSNADSTVEVIDGTTNTLTSTVIPVGTNPDFSTIDLVHGLLYVGNTAEFQPGTQSVSVIKLK